jgi:hypothetical protein
METDLIIRAELRATGAEIHRLRNLICTYKSACRDLEATHDPEIWTIKEKSEKVLRHYVHTGVLIHY